MRKGMRHLAKAALFSILAALPALAQQAAPGPVQVPQTAAQIQLSFAPVVARAAPAVVSIYATTRERRNPFADDPFFSELFRGLAPEPRARNALGSGVILDDGLVVSNFHVVQGATDIRVVLADRREYEGTLVLADRAADLAVIRLEGAGDDDLPSIPIGDSDALAVGDLVLAIGNPFGVGQTVSSGIISGLARTGSGGSALSRDRYFIQTDAPINPGNSGGALVNMRGELIGINTMIVTRSGGSVGIGFAIPANLVRAVVAQARAGADRFIRPWSGVEVQPVSADIAQALGLSRPRGVLIRRLDPDSPFAAAGLRPGDVITALGGQPVNMPAELDFRLSTHGPDETVSVEYLRDGTLQEAPVHLVAAPANALSPGRLTIAAPGPFQGLTLAAMAPDLARKLGYRPDLPGVVVVAAPRRSRASLRVGDVIQAINGQRVSTPQQVSALAERVRGWWRIDLIRGNRHVTLRTNR